MIKQTVVAAIGTSNGDIDWDAWLKYLSFVLLFMAAWYFFEHGMAAVKQMALALYRFASWVEMRHERHRRDVQEQWVRELEQRIEIDEITVNGKPLIGGTEFGSVANFKAVDSIGE